MEEAIKLTEVANGWMVELPIDNNFPIPDMGKFARQMKGAIMPQDDVLSEAVIEESLTKPVRRKVENIYFFKSFERVLEFLTKQYVD